MADKTRKRFRINTDPLFYRLAFWVALPLFVYEFFRRHNQIRTWLIRTFFLVIATRIIWGTDGIAFLLSVAAFAIQLIYALGFMMIQFVGLFWFMSRTRVTEIHPSDPKAVTFDDYWGQKYIVEHVRHWLVLISKSKQFEEMGGRPLNGLLLIGPPGTGKTMLAKAMSGEGNIAFLAMEGSGFRAMFWGVDTMKMISFVRKGRQLADRFGACVAYIDEIDAIGQSRGNVENGGQRQTQMAGGMMGMGGQSGALTRLLYEMDGIAEGSEWEVAQNKALAVFGLPMIKHGKLLFMGATNRPDVLDPALLRPGRFDESIIVGIPNEEDRHAVISGYLGTIKAADDVDVETLVLNTPGATPALLMAAITKGAVKHAIFKGRDEVTQYDIEMALQEKLIGIQNPIAGWDEKQMHAVSAHEAGHAIAIKYIRKEKRLVRASIIRRGRALGYVLGVNPKDIYAHPVRNWEEDIAVSLAGHVASEIIMGEQWTGIAGDRIKMKQLVMSLVSYGRFGAFGDAIIGDGKIDVEVRHEVNEYFKRLEDNLYKLMNLHKAELLALTDALMVQQDLTGEEVLEILEIAQEREDEILAKYS